MKNFVAGLKTCLKYIVYDVKFDNDLNTIDICISIEMSKNDRCLMRCNHWNVNKDGLIWYYNSESFRKIIDMLPEWKKQQQKHAQDMDIKFGYVKQSK